MNGQIKLNNVCHNLKAVVVGGGYIGIEAAEAFAKAGIETTIVDIADRILNTYLDKEFTDILEENSKQHGLYFKGGETVQSLSGDNDGYVTKVVTDKAEYEADTVLFAVGVEPATEWLDGKIDLGKKVLSMSIINNKHLLKMSTQVVTQHLYHSHQLMKIVISRSQPILVVKALLQRKHDW